MAIKKVSQLLSDYVLNEDVAPGRHADDDEHVLDEDDFDDPAWDESEWTWFRDDVRRHP